MSLKKKSVWDYDVSKLQDLCIDETQSTSTSPSSKIPSSISFSTPDEAEWNSFAKKVNMTPPVEISKSLDETIDIAIDLLQKGQGREVSWHSLTDEQQAMMAFVVNEDLMQFFSNQAEAARKITRAVFQVDSEGELWNKNIKNFVDKGGDKVFGQGKEARENGGLAKYQDFVNTHPIWKDGKCSTTIFSLHPHLKPILRYQEPQSMVCAAVSAAIIVDYSQHCRSGRPNDTVEVTMSGSSEAEPVVNRFAMNIARFMRTELTAKEKYKTIFESRGFRVSEMVFRIMLPSNPSIPDMDDYIRSTFCSYDVDPVVLYQFLVLALKSGPLYTDRFRVYEEYGESDTCVSEGRKTYPAKSSFHAITIVGVALTPNENGGLLFLIQDSDYNFPFKNVGLDLLLQMGVHFLLNLSQINLEFPVGGVFDLDPNFVCTFFSGGKSSSHSSRLISAEEWKAKGGPLERWHYYTNPDYVPSWARL